MPAHPATLLFSHLAVASLEDLLGEVLVDHCGLQAQAVGRVDVGGRVVSRGGRVHGGLVDREVVQLARLALVEEQRAVHLRREQHSRAEHSRAEHSRAEYSRARHSTAQHSRAE